MEPEDGDHDSPDITDSVTATLNVNIINEPASPETGVIWRFHPGRAPIQTRMRTIAPLTRQRRQQSAQTPQTPPITPFVFLWADRILQPPKPGRIRSLTNPDTIPNPMLRHLLSRDRTITEWVNEINSITEGRSTSSIIAIAYPADHEEQCWKLLNQIQRERWLARKVINRMRQRVWMKRTQCNVDLIDMEPVSERDAVYLTDMKHKVIYKFHRRDMASSFISNISMSDEMLPMPRHPTNPYTNATLTLPQTIAICQSLIKDYAARGWCPPVLFAAFCACSYDIDKFVQRTSSLLAQHAIQTYFRDITPHNLDSIIETVFQLLTEAGVEYMPISVRRWLRQTPVTPLHREWLALARDYTLYMNLHVQTRDNWLSQSFIHADVRRLFTRTQIPDATSTRLRTLRSIARGDIPGPRLPGTVSSLPFTIQALFAMPLQSPSLIQPVAPMQDALDLIRYALLGSGHTSEFENPEQDNNGASGGGGPPS
jgi:hypothetical protein